MSDEFVQTSFLPVSQPMADAIDITPLEPEEFEDPKVKLKAYDMFINSMMDLDQIAVALSLPMKSVRTWARHGNWVSRKQDLLEVAMKASDQKMQEFVMKERQPTAERHLKVAKKLEEVIEKTVAVETRDDGSMKPSDIRTLAEALSSAAGVSGKAVGITEMGISSGLEEKSKKTPVVIINLAPTLSRSQD